MKNPYRLAVVSSVIAIATAATAAPKTTCVASAPIHQGPATALQICGSLVNTCNGAASVRAAVVPIGPTGPEVGFKDWDVSLNTLARNGGGSACQRIEASGEHQTHVVGMVTTCSIGAQVPPIVTLSVREEMSDPTTNSVYRVPTKTITVGDTGYGVLSAVCSEAGDGI